MQQDWLSRLWLISIPLFLLIHTSTKSVLHFKAVIYMLPSTLAWNYWVGAGNFNRMHRLAMPI